MEGRTGTREGVGLGLSIARSVATADGATVSARARTEGGLDITVVIPAATPHAGADSPG
jgi:signal transduction histidine kinase